MHKKAAFILLLILIMSNKAYAYIDPGTGSILVQALLAAFAAVGTFVTLSWRKFKDFINKIFKIKKKN